MGFQTIKFYNFRNLINDEINIDSPVVFLIGQNGQGKTNFIEAIHYLCYGSSFKSKKDKFSIKHKEDFCVIQCNYRNEENANKKIKIKINQKNKKEISIDKKMVFDRKMLIENMPCIIFSYSDMSIVTGEPEKKRLFLNQTQCLFDIVFLELIKNYKKAIKNKNIALKNMDIEMIKALNIQIAKIGNEIQKKRMILVDSFNNILIPLYKKIFDNNNELKILYKPSWKNVNEDNEIVDYLNMNISNDLKFLYSTTGPHRDNFIFLYNGDEFIKFCSTGQVRLVALIIKIVQAKLYYQCRKKKPILLIDDVLLELDFMKRKKIIQNLPDYDQAFFTFLPNENFFQYAIKNKKIFLINNGRVLKWKEQEIY